jgi:hypothetical protein
MDKYWTFLGKIITLSSFLSAPQKRVQFAYLGPTVDIHQKKVGAESVKTGKIRTHSLLVFSRAYSNHYPGTAPKRLKFHNHSVRQFCKIFSKIAASSE